MEATCRELRRSFRRSGMSAERYRNVLILRSGKNWFVEGLSFGTREQARRYVRNKNDT